MARGKTDLWSTGKTNAKCATELSSKPQSKESLAKAMCNQGCMTIKSGR